MASGIPKLTRLGVSFQENIRSYAAVPSESWLHFLLLTCVKQAFQRWSQGRRKEALTGGGADSGPSNPPTPNSDFSSDFSHLVLKILKNL